MRILSAAIIGSALLLPVTAFASQFIYCGNGQIRMDTEVPSGPNFCQMGPPFSTWNQARDFAERNYGGLRASCRCR